jgi:MraZ protein
MTQFMGTHINRLDAKGRISIPAPFRAALKAQPGGGTILLRRSHLHPCVDVWPVAMLEKAAQRLAEMDPLSRAHEEISAQIYGDSFPTEADKEGRIVVPQRYLAYAGITDAVSVTGRGIYFQLWEPAAGERRIAAAYAAWSDAGAAP